MNKKWIAGLLIMMLIFVVQLLWPADVAQEPQMLTQPAVTSEGPQKAIGNQPESFQPSQFGSDLTSQPAAVQTISGRQDNYPDDMTSTEKEIAQRGDAVLVTYFQQDVSLSEKYRALMQYKELLEIYESDAKMGLLKYVFGVENPGARYEHELSFIHLRLYLLSNANEDAALARSHRQQAVALYNQAASALGVPVESAADLEKFIVQLDKMSAKHYKDA